MLPVPAVNVYIVLPPEAVFVYVNPPPIDNKSPLVDG
jgi:hypothetical protein